MANQLRSAPFPGASRPVAKGYGRQHKDVVRKARKWQICQGGSWHPSCGRTIEAGERYLSLYRGGLAQFHVCSDCADLGEQVQPC